MLNFELTKNTMGVTSLRVPPKCSLEFEATEYSTEGENCFDSDIGGKDGWVLTGCTIKEAEVTDGDTGNVSVVDRAELVSIFGESQVCDEEELLLEIEVHS